MESSAGQKRGAEESPAQDETSAKRSRPQAEVEAANASVHNEASLAADGAPATTPANAAQASPGETASMDIAAREGAQAATVQPTGDATLGTTPAAAAVVDAQALTAKAAAALEAAMKLAQEAAQAVAITNAAPQPNAQAAAAPAPAASAGSPQPAAPDQPSDVAMDDLKPEAGDLAVKAEFGAEAKGAANEPAGQALAAHEPAGDAVKLAYKTFYDMSECRKYFQRLLAHLSKNQNLNKYEHEVVFQLLCKGHPDPARKIGAGVENFQVRDITTGDQTTQCFFIIRTDGSCDDFSTRKCIDALFPEAAAASAKQKNGGRGGGGRGRGGRGGRGGGGRDRGRGGRAGFRGRRGRAGGNAGRRGRG